MTDTLLDRAFGEMVEDDDAARLRFLGRLAAAEVFLLLEDEPQGETVEARIFPIDPDPVALIFDTEERLTSFAGGPAPYAAMSGRAIATLLAGRGIGLGLNLGSGVSDFVLAPNGVSWLAETATAPVGSDTARLIALSAPMAVPERVIAEIDARLAAFEGQARRAYLASAELDGGGMTHVLAVIGASEVARPAIAEAVNAALVFSAVDAAALDVIFPDDGLDLISRLDAVGLRIDLPEPVAPPTPAAPGSNPDAPPKLR